MSMFPSYFADVITLGVVRWEIIWECPVGSSVITKVPKEGWGKREAGDRGGDMASCTDGSPGSKHWL